MITVTRVPSTVDPFEDESRCIERLIHEYYNREYFIVAFDFDNTVFDCYQQGYTYDGVINLLKRCQNLNMTLVLYTCNAEDAYGRMKDHLASFGIYPDYINENPEGISQYHGKKLYYNILLDDRAGLGSAMRMLAEVLEKLDPRSDKYVSQLSDGVRI